MSTYLVRLQGGYELVGMFVADSRMALFWSIDEVTNPGQCEFCRLSDGDGVMFPLPGGGQMESCRIKGITDDSAEINLDGIAFTESAIPKIIALDDQDWQRFEPGFSHISA